MHINIMIDILLKEELFYDDDDDYSVFLRFHDF